MSRSLEPLAPSMRELRARFETEIEPHRSELWHYCRRLTGSAWDAEDLVQETLQRALAGLANLWQPAEPRAYLFRVATNAWIDRKRKDLRLELEELVEDVPASGPAPQLRLEAHEGLAHVVEVLTPLQRAVFLLRDTLDFTTRETAAVLGTTEGAVKIALHRARRGLAERPPQAGGTPARLLRPEEGGELVRRYVEAFDARDPDAIAALLHEDAATSVVGSAEELGRETARRSSLAEWAEEPVEQWARPGRLEKRTVLFVFARDDRGGEALYSMIELQIAGDVVTGQRIYFFSPELLEYAAAALGVRAWTHGHRYPFAEDA